MSPSALPLAVVGMPGAGKSQLTDLLVEGHGFERIYFGQVVLDELAGQGVPPSPAAERSAREQLRRAEGMDVMAARSLPSIRGALSRTSSVCIDGLYSLAEWRLLARETGVITLAVHAPRWLRKARLAARPVRPLLGAELDARDVAEVDELQKAEPIALADAHLVNDATVDDLRRGLERVLGQLDEIGAARLRVG